MKTLIHSCIFIILFSANLFAQGILGGYKEIYTRTNNITVYDTVFFKLQSIGSVWAWDDTPPYDIATTYNGYSIVESDLYIVGNYDGWEKGWEGLVPGGPHYPPYFSHSFYKFNIRKNYNGQPIFFYINFRDSDWDGGTYNCGNDIYFFYQGSDNTLDIQWGGSNCNITTVTNGQVYNFWTEKGKEDVATDNFSNFWQNCLILGPFYGNHPRLIWGPYPDSEFGATHYRVYIKVEQGSWNLRAVVGSTTFEFIDNQVDLNSKVDEINYHIKAYNGGTESSATNTVPVIGEYNPPYKEISQNNNAISNKKIFLSCFPNPSNPSTTIAYSLKEKSKISLIVYDILGRELEVLIDEIQEAGEYRAQFNASGYASGVYICTLNVNGQKFVKKMLLTK